MDDSWAREWIDAYAEAWRSKDDEAVAALFTEGGVYRSSPFRPASTGTEEIREYWRGATSTQEGLDLRFGEPVVHGNRVVVEWWVVMTDDGREITLPGALLLRFAHDGRCEELREYWHVEDGRHEPPEGWGR
jgi:ketosteroid isomerase-like protein